MWSDIFHVAQRDTASFFFAIVTRGCVPTAYLQGFASKLGFAFCLTNLRKPRKIYKVKGWNGKMAES